MPRRGPQWRGSRTKDEGTAPDECTDECTDAGALKTTAIKGQRHMGTLKQGHHDTVASKRHGCRKDTCLQASRFRLMWIEFGGLTEVAAAASEARFPYLLKCAILLQQLAQRLGCEAFAPNNSMGPEPACHCQRCKCQEAAGMSGPVKVGGLTVT